MRPSWLRYRYEAEYRLDAAGPNWLPSVLKEVRLPRWTYEGHDRGAALFVRVSQKLPEGPAEARLSIGPERPLPQVALEIDLGGRWSQDDQARPAPAAFADILEEAEGLLVLLGCRSPRFFHDATTWMR